MSLYHEWKVAGTRNGKIVTALVSARDHNEAVRKASHSPFMLVVRDCVRVDPREYDGTLAGRMPTT